MEYVETGDVLIEDDEESDSEIESGDSSDTASEEDQDYDDEDLMKDGDEEYDYGVEGQGGRENEADDEEQEGDGVIQQPIFQVGQNDSEEEQGSFMYSTQSNISSHFRTRDPTASKKYPRSPRSKSLKDSPYNRSLLKRIRVVRRKASPVGKKRNM